MLAATAASFVGRERDLAALATLFDDGARLVTILGPGGMGKTRLALHFLEHHAEAAWACDLAAARTAADVCVVIASALRVPLGHGADELGALLARRDRVVLLLDNFESVHPAASALVSQLLEAAPRASFLVTSRIALAIAGEHLWPLEPLVADDAAKLFVDRARQVRPGFAPGDADRAAILEIAQRVDGIPLAIELAAARAGVLTPAQIVSRLGPHLATMARTIEGSLAMATEGERACLAEASVFRGGFTLDAAEAVIGSPRVLERLDALRSRSLVHVVASQGDLRFAIYEPIREIVADRIDDALRRSHLAFFAGLGRTLAESRDLSAIAIDLDNFVAAHDAAIALECFDEAIDLALAIDPIVRARGHSGLRLRLLDEAIARRVAKDERLARALTARAETHRGRGSLDAARRDFDTALALAPSPDLGARIRVGIAELVESQGATAEARTWLDAAIATSTGATLASARTHLAHALRREGRLDDADREAAHAMILYREAHDDDGLARAVFESGVIALFRERHDDAIAAFDSTRDLARRAGVRTLEASAITAKGTLLQERGLAADAITHHTEALAIFREINDPYAEGSTLYYLAGAYLEQGQPADAEAIAIRALALVESVASHRYEALVRGLLAAIDTIRGRPEAARVLRESAARAASLCPTEPSLEAAIAIHALPPTALAEARTIASSHLCDDPRFALRVLELRSRSSPSLAPLVIRAGGIVRVPGQPEIDLSRRLPLRRVLEALAIRRRDSPGEPLSLDDIIAAGWPDERLGRAAGVNRAHVALAELRKLGLRDVIVSTDRGYALTTTLPILIEP